MVKLQAVSVTKGIIFKATTGFYYVRTDCGLVSCRARGKFRLDGIAPLVGDKVVISLSPDGSGVIKEVLERKNYFIRPAVANLEAVVIITSESIPVTDPYLIDRIMVIAEQKSCEPLICVNKTDLNGSDRLYDIYASSGFRTIRTSAVTREGIDELYDAIAGRICAFTGNSGVGKSSIINALSPDYNIETGEISLKLGRGRHTTRHVELFDMPNGAVIADTPGFGSFDSEEAFQIPPGELQFAFQEFEPYLGQCRFDDCAHIKEPNCAVLNALSDGKIQASRHKSYVRLYGYILELNRNKYD